MTRGTEVSRRSFLTGIGSVVAGGALTSAHQAKDVPVVQKRVEKLFTVAGCRQPNDIGFAPDGLWVIDQVDPNKAFKVNPENGAVIHEIQTESYHGSGIAYGNGALWITSTQMSDPKLPPRTLKVDPQTGKTLKSWITPGAGRMTHVGAGPNPSGGHGLKWVNGKYWMAVPPSGKIYLIEPETGEPIRSIPAPGPGTHGVAWDNGALWCIEYNDRVIYKLDVTTGHPLAKIFIARSDPDPHGLDIRNGVLWYSDTATGLICRLV